MHICHKNLFSQSITVFFEVKYAKTTKKLVNVLKLLKGTIRKLRQTQTVRFVRLRALQPRTIVRHARPKTKEGGLLHEQHQHTERLLVLHGQVRGRVHLLPEKRAAKRTALGSACLDSIFVARSGHNSRLAGQYGDSRMHYKCDH